MSEDIAGYHSRFDLSEKHGNGPTNFLILRTQDDQIANCSDIGVFVRMPRAAP